MALLNTEAVPDKMSIGSSQHIMKVQDIEVARRKIGQAKPLGIMIIEKGIHEEIGIEVIILTILEVEEAGKITKGRITGEMIEEFSKVTKVGMLEEITTVGETGI